MSEDANVADPRGDNPAAQSAERERLEIFDGLVAAFSRRTEVFEIMCDASDPAEALTALQQLLDVKPVVAAAIVDLQLRRFTTRDRLKVTAIRDDLKAHADARDRR